MREDHKLLKWFTYRHLPVAYQVISMRFNHLANEMQDDIQYWGPEFDEGMRKLLEAKDCFVRAAIESEERAKEL